MYKLTLQDVLNDAKIIKRQYAGQGTFWSLTDCVLSVCENSSTIVEPDIKTNALLQAEELDKLEQAELEKVK